MESTLNETLLALNLEPEPCKAQKLGGRNVEFGNLKMNLHRTKNPQVSADRKKYNILMQQPRSLRNVDLFLNC